MPFEEQEAAAKEDGSAENQDTCQQLSETRTKGAKRGRRRIGTRFAVLCTMLMMVMRHRQSDFRHRIGAGDNR